MPGITVVNIDALSDVKYQTLQHREAEIPMARSIIKEQLTGFIQWYDMRKSASALNGIKARLIKMQQQNQLFAAHGNSDQKAEIQTVLNVMANKLRHENPGGCHYIEAINYFMDNRIA